LFEQLVASDNVGKVLSSDQNGIGTYSENHFYPFKKVQTPINLKQRFSTLRDSRTSW